MKTKCTYIFSRLIVLLVALHTLNVSIDVDFLTSRVQWYNAEYFDDIDSFSELILEKVFDNDRLFAEREREDRCPSEKQVSKFLAFIFYSGTKAPMDLSPISTAAKSYRPRLRNTRFRLEDHSRTLLHPPDVAC